MRANAERSFFMQQEVHYQIWKLPIDSIVEIYSKKCNRESKFYRITAGTFPEVEQVLRIRPKAANFYWMNNLLDNIDSAIYAVLYCTEEKTECRFFFKIVRSVYYDGISEVRLCRCLGKHKVKHHRELVRELVEEEYEIIESLKKMEYRDFFVKI